MRPIVWLPWFLAVGLLGESSWATERVVAALDWHKSDAAASCMDAAALALAVEAKLARKVFVTDDQADIRIRVALDSAVEGNWSSSIDLFDPKGRSLGHRELAISGEHCAALDESLVLMVSLMLDVTRESVQQPPSEPASTPLTKAIETSLPTFAPTQAAPKAPAASPVAIAPEFRFYALGSLSEGQVPGLGRGVTLRGQWATHAWSAGISAALWAPAQTSQDGLGARFGLATLEASACGALMSTRSRELAVCAGYQTGLLRSRSFGFDVNQSKSSITQVLSCRLGATFWATALFGLHGALGVGVPLVQDEYFGTRSDGSTLRLFSRRTLVPTADFGMAFRLGL